MRVNPKGVDPLCKEADPYAKSLIKILSLQAHTRSETRLAADDFML